MRSVVLAPGLIYTIAEMTVTLATLTGVLQHTKTRIAAYLRLPAPFHANSTQRLQLVTSSQGLTVVVAPRGLLETRMRKSEKRFHHHNKKQKTWPPYY